MSMTPAEIEVLIHFHAGAQCHPRSQAPAVIEATKRFLQEGLIEVPVAPGLMAPPTAPGIYRTTARGKVLVEMLCNTPLPVVQWVDPRSGIIVGGDAMELERIARQRCVDHG